MAAYLTFHKPALSELQRGEPQACELEDTLRTPSLVNQDGKGLISAPEASGCLTMSIIPLSKRG